MNMFMISTFCGGWHPYCKQPTGCSSGIIHHLFPINQLSFHSWQLPTMGIPVLHKRYSDLNFCLISPTWSIVALFLNALCSSDQYISGDKNEQGSNKQDWQSPDLGDIYFLHYLINSHQRVQLLTRYLE